MRKQKSNPRLDISKYRDVGIWIRVSTEDQAQGDSPEHHERRARAYADAKGWNVREVYHLEGVSGKSVMEHPETKRMLVDVKSGRITALVFSKLARLARNTTQLLEFSDIFNAHGADLVSLQESIDTSTPAGRLFYTMIAAMAQWEREEIASRVAASVPIRAQLGKNTGGQAPFGYQWKDNKLIPDPNEAPVRKLMYELFLEHRRKKKVATLLNERGFRTRNGSEFSDTTVSRLLKDPTAKGLRRANYTATANSGKAWSLKPKEQWVEVEVPAIVSEDLWSACNAVLEGNKARRTPVARKPVHLFAGLAYCGCGTKMYVPSNSPKYICQNCRTKIPVTDLEGVFAEQLKGFFTSPGDISSAMERASGQLTERTELIKTLNAERKKISSDLDVMIDLYGKGGITIEAFTAKSRPMEERLRQIEEELPKLEAQLDVMKIDHLSTAEVVSGAKDLYGNWGRLSSSEKRDIVEAITDRLVITKTEVEVNLLYLPPFLNSGSNTTSAQGFIAATSWKRAG